MAQRVALLGFAIVAALGTSATAAGSTYPRGALSFSGTCHFSGEVAFKPGLSNEPQTIRQRVHAPGSCSGTFVDRRGASHPESDAKVVYTATEVAPNSSCSGGTDAGRGALVTPYGKLRFRISEARAGAGVVATATGARGGSAAGTAAPSSSGDPTVLAD